LQGRFFHLHTTWTLDAQLSKETSESTQQLQRLIEEAFCPFLLFSSKNVAANEVIRAIFIIVNIPTKKISAGATVMTQPAYEESQEP
jgi:1,2-phenylacetyl-CoA epoxidase catalytic subunit